MADNRETMLKTAGNGEMTMNPNIKTKPASANQVDLNPISEELIAEFSEWLDQELDHLEERFESFVTKSSIKADIKSSRS